LRTTPISLNTLVRNKVRGLWDRYVACPLLGNLPAGWTGQGKGLICFVGVSLASLIYITVAFHFSSVMDIVEQRAAAKPLVDSFLVNIGAGTSSRTTMQTGLVTFANVPNLFAMLSALPVTLSLVSFLLIWPAVTWGRQPVKTRLEEVALVWLMTSVLAIPLLAIGVCGLWGLGRIALAYVGVLSASPDTSGMSLGGQVALWLVYHPIMAFILARWRRQACAPCSERLTPSAPDGAECAVDRS